MRQTLLRLGRAELRRSRTVSVTLVILITICAALTATGLALIARTMAATNTFWTEAIPPDVVQVHSGQEDAAALERDVEAWAAEQPGIADHMVMVTLPVPGSQLWIDGAVQSDSVLEPALVTSPERFDLLVDASGRRVDPSPGEIWLPVHYEAEGLAEVGDAVRVTAGQAELDLTVVGFVRDAQMNSSLATSKRVVVSQADYEAVAPYLEPEYYIEMLAADGVSNGDLKAAYAASGLPDNGIMVDSTIFRLLNGMSTFVLAAAVLLVAGVLAVVVLLALRFALLAAFEEDLGQIGALKAIGAPTRSIRLLYLVKYAGLALAGSAVGLAAAFPLTATLQQPIELYLGRPSGVLAMVLAPVVGAVLTAVVVIGSCWLMLARINLLSAVEALRAAATGSSVAPRRRRRPWSRAERTVRTDAQPGAPRSRSRRSTLLASRLSVPDRLGLTAAMHRANGLLLAVVALCVLAAVIPASILATVGDARFATYLGVGQADVRIDVRDGTTSTAEVEAALATRGDVDRHVVLVSDRYELRAADGEWGTVVVESGDHDVFPLSYDQGTAPATEQQIALSVGEASELGIGVGDEVTLRVAQEEVALEVSGIYQDVTNGGKTAKARLVSSQTPLWQVVYLDLSDGADPAPATDELSAALPGAKVTLVSQHAAQTMGALVSQLRTVAIVGAVAGCALVLIITTMSTTLVIARERGALAALRAIGADRSALRRMYLVRFGLIAAAGTLLGSLAAQLLGQVGFRLALSGLGAPGVVLLPDPLISWVGIPAAVLASVLAAVGLGLHALDRIHLTEQE